MRKRINDKQSKNQKQSLKPKRKQQKQLHLVYPLLTLEILHKKTRCLVQLRQFQKDHISNIIRGRTIESVKFQQIQKNCSFQEFMNKYYTFKDTKQIFTQLINRNSLVENITFVDFKLKNYKIMNKYCKLMKNIQDDKSKSRQTASCSLDKDRCFKEKQIEVKKITKKNNINNQKQNGSHQFTNILVKNIQKMLKNYKDNSILLSKQKSNTKSSKKLCKKQIKSLKKPQNQRLNTTPQNYLDNYGLQAFKSTKNKKMIWSSMFDPNDSKLIKLNTYYQPLRHQTQYDTQYIYCNQSKKIEQQKKRSVNKLKSLSFKKKQVRQKQKSVSINKVCLKLKK